MLYIQALYTFCIVLDCNGEYLVRVGSDRTMEESSCLLGVFARRHNRVGPIGARTQAAQRTLRNNHGA